MKTIVYLGPIAALLIASASFAQTGVGFPLGEKSRLHTNLDVGFSYDTNPERLNQTLQRSNVRGLVRPAFSIDVPSSNLSLGLGAGLTFSRFFGLDGSPTSNEVGADFVARAEARPSSGKVGLRLMNRLARTPTYIGEIGALTLDDRRFPSWINKGQVSVIFRPGGGALEIDVGYLNQLLWYDDLPNSQEHIGQLETRLKFLPKTAALVRATLGLFDSTAPEPDMGGPAATSKATPFSVGAGLRGQVTTRISADLFAGFADSLTWTGDFFSTAAPSNRKAFITTAGIGYSPFTSAVLTASYTRSIQQLIILDNYVANVFVIGIRWAIDRLQLGARGTYDIRNYGRNDQDSRVITGDAKAELKIKEYLFASINYRVLHQDTTPLPAAIDPSAAVFLEDYVRHSIMLSMGLHY